MAKGVPVLFLLLFTATVFGAEPKSGSAADLLAPLLNANRTLNKTPAKTADMSCACTVNGSENKIPFETAGECGPGRDYLAGAIQAFRKIDPSGHYLNTRPYAGGKNLVPPKCVLYVMRTTFRDVPRTVEQKKQEDVKAGLSPEEIAKKTYVPDPSLFATCASPSGTPVRYGQKPCVTEEYFNLVYNSLADVAECLDLPMNFTIPKFANESGLNVNAFGPVNDGGIGQFTESALRDIAVNYPEFRGSVMNSAKPACKRLRSITGAFVKSPAEIRTADAERCHAIAMPPNPVRSLIYYGIFYHASKRYSANAWNGVDAKDPYAQTVDDLLSTVGGKLNREKIKQMLFVMGYNAGPRPPVTAFKEWLRYRGSLKGGTISNADFDFQFWPPKGFSAIQKQAEADMIALGAKQRWSEDRIRQEIFRERVKRRIALLGAGKRALTLPEYFFVYQNSIYISAVKAQATRIDKAMGEGTCTQPKFLQL